MKHFFSIITVKLLFMAILLTEFLLLSLVILI